MPVRPAGTDGSDHAFRMTIENRYKTQAETRKLLQKLAKLSILLVALKVAWTTGFPLLKEGINIFDEDVLLVGAASAALVLYILGSGATPLLRENAPALQVYVAVQLLIAVLATRDAWRLCSASKGPHADARAGALLARGLAQELWLPLHAAARYAWFVDLGMAAFTALTAVSASKAGSRFLRVKAAASPSAPGKKAA